MSITGIDLGTSNSAAAILCGGRTVTIPGAECISYFELFADGVIKTRVQSS
ncbi:MAG: hypothetical protein WAW02_03810 [Sideroxyarcus sp.]